ncbi:MAG: beta strand repeat-containing protein, partial [Opitutales bacterium]
VGGDNTSPGAYAGVISGTGNLLKTGAGALTLSGTNTYTGTTTVSQGTVQVNANAPSGSVGTLGNATSVVTLNDANTGANNTALLIGTSGVTVGRAVTVANSGTGTTTLGGNITSGTGSFTGNIILNKSASLEADGTATLTFGTGVISGTGGVTKTGTGTALLSGANTYTGATTVNDGKLQAGVASVANTSGAFGNNSAVTMANVAGATLALNNFNTQIGSLTGGGTTGGNVTLGTATLTVGGDNTSPGAYAGIISGTGSLTKIGTGTLALSGSNTYIGITTINAGKVQVSADNNLGSAPGSATPGQLTLGGGTLEATTGFTLNSNRGIALTSSTTSNLTADTGQTLAYGGIIAGSGNLTYGTTSTGTGAVTLSGANTYTGTTAVNAGTVLASNNAALGAGSANVTVASGGTLSLDSGVTVANSATLSLAGTGTSSTVGALNAAGTAGTTSQWTGNFALTGNATVSAANNLLILGNGSTYANTFNLGSNTLTLNTTSATGVTTTYLNSPSYILDPTNVLVNAKVTGTGGLTKTGAGTATLISFPAPGVAYTGTTLVTGGKLIVDGTSANGSTYGPVINSSSVIVGNSSSPGAANSVVLQMGQLADAPAASNLIGSYTSGTNTATASLTVYADGLFNMNGGSTSFNTLTLQGGHVSEGSETYSPLLTLVGGVTTLASANTALIDNGEVGMSNNAFTFTVATGTTSSGVDLEIDSILHNGIGFTNANTATSLAKTGTGTMVLTATNDYKGVTDIQQGILNIQNGSALGGTSSAVGALDNGTVVENGAQLQLQGGITVGNETLTLNGTGVGSNGALYNLSGSNTYNGYVNLATDSRINAASGTNLNIASTSGVNAGILNGNSAGTNLTVGGAGNTQINGAIGSYVGNVTKDGTGTLTLAGNNAYTGATDVTSGAVKVTNNSGLAGSGATVSSGAALQFAQDASSNNITAYGVAATINGTGLSNGGAIENLNGSNSYAGNITLGSNSRVTADSGSSLTLTGSVNGAGYALQAGGAGSTTYNGVISGTGTAFTKTDSGTVTLGGSGANTFTGGLNVNDGTLNLNKTAGVNAVGASSTVTVGDGIGSPLSANLNVQASNLLPTSTALVLNSDGRIGLGTSAASVSTLAGTGQIDLGTTGSLTVGASNASSTFGGSVTGSGTLVKAGTGTLDLTSTITASSATLDLSGGILKLSGINLTLGTLDITGNSTIDFSGVSGILSVGTLSFLSTSITLNIINWNSAVTYFYATNWTGGAVQNVTGTLPMTQIVFDSPTYTGNNTVWDSYDNQIYPKVPEPTTYGAAFLALCAAFYFWRRRHRAQASAPAAN